MKLGTQTGSLVNHIMSNTIAAKEITVGMGATFLSWTDRNPGTVIDTFKKGVFTYVRVRCDRVDYNENGKSTNDFGGKYDIVDGDDDVNRLFRFKTDGSTGFQEVHLNANGRYIKVRDGGLALGRREYYYDPSF